MTEENENNRDSEIKRKCPKCGYIDPLDDSEFCMKCGAAFNDSIHPPLNSSTLEIKPQNSLVNRALFTHVVCPQCEFLQQYHPQLQYCHRCGAEFSRNESGKLTVDQNYMVFLNAQAERELKPLPAEEFEHTKPRKTWSFWPGIIMPAVLFGLMTALGAIISVVLIFNDLSSLTDMSTQFWLGSLSLFFLIGPVVWVNRYYNQRLTLKDRLKVLGLPIEKYTPSEHLREALIGIGLGSFGVFFVLLLQFFALWLIASLLGINMDSYDSVLQNFGMDSPTTLSDLVIYIFMILLFVGVPEEILFRGFVQRSFEAKISRKAALWLTAIYFSLFHIFIYLLVPVVFFFLFIPYMGVSLLLGLVRNWRKDLFAAVWMHITYDVIQMVVIFVLLS